jgi:hypothetical protein
MNGNGGARGPGPALVIGGLLAGILLAGCGAPDALPAPGADGLVVVHWWDEKRPGPPAYLQAERLVQGDAEFKKLEFTTVMMRLPGDGGVVYVTAPYASYDRGAANQIQMGVAPGSQVDGPVRFIGTWNGDLLMGRADRAVFVEATHRMRLEAVEITSRGLRERTAWAEITREQTMPFGAVAHLPDAPALTAALAALPAPLVLPPVRRD